MHPITALMLARSEEVERARMADRRRRTRVDRPRIEESAPERPRWSARLVRLILSGAQA